MPTGHREDNVKVLCTPEEREPTQGRKAMYLYRIAETGKAGSYPVQRFLGKSPDRRPGMFARLDQGEPAVFHTRRKDKKRTASERENSAEYSRFPISDEEPTPRGEKRPEMGEEKGGGSNVVSPQIGKGEREGMETWNNLSLLTRPLHLTKGDSTT